MSRCWWGGAAGAPRGRGGQCVVAPPTVEAKPGAECPAEGGRLTAEAEPRSTHSRRHQIFGSARVADSRPGEECPCGTRGDGWAEGPEQDISQRDVRDEGSEARGGLEEESGWGGGHQWPEAVAGKEWGQSGPGGPAALRKHEGTQAPGKGKQDQIKLLSFF